MTTQRSRKELREMFKQGEEPSGGDFSDLIYSTLNVKDDYIERPSGRDNPLQIKVKGEEGNILEVVSVENEEVLSLTQLSADKRSGLNLQVPKYDSRLFIDGESGNIGINSGNPLAKLHIRQTEQKDSLRIDCDNKGSKSVVVSSEGRVGIGITAPKAELSVNGKFQLVGDAEITGTAEIKKTLTVSGKTKVEKEFEVGKDLTVQNNGLIKGKLTTSGFVGIGTKEPKSQLSIAGFNNTGKWKDPDEEMHVRADSILFGGKNKDRKGNSAQISVGWGGREALEICGMVGEDNKETSRKINMFAEGGMTINGELKLQKSSEKTTLGVINLGGWKIEVEGDLFKFSYKGIEFGYKFRKKGETTFLNKTAENDFIDFWAPKSQWPFPPK